MSKRLDKPEQKALRFALKGKGNGTLQPRVYRKAFNRTFGLAAIGATDAQVAGWYSMMEASARVPNKKYQIAA